MGCVQVFLVEVVKEISRVEVLSLHCRHLGFEFRGLGGTQVEGRSF